MTNSVFSKILVCVEDSPCSNKALLRSCELAKKFNSKLSLIYVVDKPPSVKGLGLGLIDRGEFVKMFKDYGKNALKKAGKIAEKMVSKQKQ